MIKIHPLLTKKLQVRLISCLKFFNLNDVFCKTNPAKKVNTQMQFQPYMTTRLDFFLISNNLIKNVKLAIINQSLHSEYRIVSLEISINETKWEQGYWKINSKILNNISILF